MEKTSQALREGQTEIRKRIYDGEVKEAGLPDCAPENCSSSNFDSYQNNNVLPPNVYHEMSPERYFDYSLKVLWSFYGTEERKLSMSDETEDTLRKLVKAANVTPTTPTSAYVYDPTSSSANKNYVDMAMVLDHNPRVLQSQVDPLQAPIGCFTNMSSDFRLTDMSGTSHDMSTELMELFQQAWLELADIDNETFEDNLYDP